jgi:hypothetical protein
MGEVVLFKWNNTVQLDTPREYVCGYCGRYVGPNIGYFAPVTSGAHPRIYICSSCTNPTYFDQRGSQVPGAPFGKDVASVPPDVAALYAEARACMKVNAFTAAVLTCRKLLMHLAVEKGAPVGSSFLQYVEYLSDKNYIPPDGKGWVDYIRTKGNEANHEIRIMSLEEGRDLITFSEMLLKFVYEFPAKVKPLLPPPAAAPNS